MTYATALKPTEAQTCATYPNFNNFQESSALNTSPQFTEAFPTEIVWIDREGYPMTEETVENGYDDPQFITYPNEPF